jgi:hypothetical protein
VRDSGLTAEFGYLDKSAAFFWVPPGYKAAISYDSVGTVLRQAAPRFRSIDNKIRSIRVVPLSMKLATYNLTMQSASVDTAGSAASVVLIESGVVVKRSDGWKLMSGQTAVVE